MRHGQPHGRALLRGNRLGAGLALRGGAAWPAPRGAGPGFPVRSDIMSRKTPSGRCIKGRASSTSRARPSMRSSPGLRQVPEKELRKRLAPSMSLRKSAAPSLRTRLSGSSPSGRNRKRACLPSPSRGRVASSARHAALLPARRRRSSKPRSSAARSDRAACSAVVAVPSVATSCGCRTAPARPRPCSLRPPAGHPVGRRAARQVQAVKFVALVEELGFR